MAASSASAEAELRRRAEGSDLDDAQHAALELAQLLAAADRYSEMEPIFFRLSQADRHSIAKIARCNLANLMLATDRATEAVPLFRAVTEDTREPDMTGPANLGLAQALHDLGRTREAEEHLESAASAAPEFSDVASRVRTGWSERDRT